MERQSNLVTILVTFLLVVAASGCSGSGNSAIVGDWFQCKAPTTCEELLAGGVRYRSDGTWVKLAAKGSTLDDAEKYCLKYGAKSQGEYSWDGKVLKATTAGTGEVEEWGMEVTGTEATRTNLATSSYVKLKSVSDRASGFCGSGASDAGADSALTDAKTDGIPPVVLDSTPYFPDF